MLKIFDTVNVTPDLLQVLERAAEGLDVDIENLTRYVTQEDNRQMPVISGHVISTALRLTSAEKPQWRYFAGRLKVWNLYHEIRNQRGERGTGIYENYLNTVLNLIEQKVYVPELTEKYTREEIEQAASFIDPDYDMQFDYAGINLMQNRYLSQVGHFIVELPQEAFLTIALLLNQNEPHEIRLDRVRKTYHMLAARKISLATPLLLNLRRPGGNLSSCFIVSADDYLESIYYVIETCALISKQGGGVATDWSRIRAKGGSIKGIPNVSGGVTPWIKVINDTAVAVNQQGKRAGSITVALDIWHLDVEEFLELQTENGDQRKKAFDVFPQLVIPDEFMKRVEDNSDWYMFDPHEINSKFGIKLYELWGSEFTEKYRELVNHVNNFGRSLGLDLQQLHSHDFDSAYRTLLDNQPQSDRTITLVKKVKARDLLKQIMRTQIETGLPYMAFKDTINRGNPNKGSGYIPCVNLCVESYSNVKPAKVYTAVNEDNVAVRRAEGGENHTCNLVSVNLANLLHPEELEEAVRESVRILDNTIELTVAPVLESSYHNRLYRTIGIGVMGYADYAAWHKVPYQRSEELAEELFENIAYFSFDESAALAEERGSFEAYEHSDFAKGLILSHDRNWFRQNAKSFERWDELFKRIEKSGMRNSQLLAVAPNTSSALLQGVTASVLPVFSRFFIDDNSKGSIPIAPPYLKERFWFYQEFKNIDQQSMVTVISAMQKWIDTGISMELLFNLNRDEVDAKYIYDTLMHAWKRGSKAVYYIRSIQKDGSMSEKEECVSCAG